MDLTAGKVAWTDQKVKDVFAQWARIQPLHHGQPCRDRLAGRSRAARAGQGRQLCHGQLCRRHLQGRRHDQRQSRLHGIPGNHRRTCRAPRKPRPTRSTFRLAPRMSTTPRSSWPSSLRLKRRPSSTCALGQLPTNKNSTVGDDPFLKAGFEIAVERPMRLPSSSTVTLRRKWQRQAWKASRNSW